MITSSQPEIRHHFSGGVYAKETIIPAGMQLVQHAHKFEHLSILAQGTVEMIIDGCRRVVHAPACLTIQQNKHHGVKALTDTVWFCVHSTDCTDSESIDEVLIAPMEEVDVQHIAQCLKLGV